MTLAVAVAALLGWPTPARVEPREVHGEDSVFAEGDVAIVWGVLRGASERETDVVMRIAVSGQAYAAVAVEAVDPFSRARRLILGRELESDVIDVRSPRAGFADLPRREVRLYPTLQAWRAGTPALTVYYLGVPDTTPEFTAEATLGVYLAETIEKIQGAPGIRAP